KRIHPKSSLVTWLITLGLIICPSSYKARPDNLIGLYLLTDFCEEIISPQRSDTRPNFPTKSFVGVAKFVWHPGYQRALMAFKLWRTLQLKHKQDRKS